LPENDSFTVPFCSTCALTLQRGARADQGCQIFLGTTTWYNQDRKSKQNCHKTDQMAINRVTRWVFKKIAQNVAQTIFCQN
jgi:hypothetical protein